MVSRAVGVVAALLLITAVAADTSQSAAAGATSAPRCTPARKANPGTVQQTLPYGGLERPYELTIPKRYDGRRPAHW